jgi:hypothetical protein
MSSYADLKIVAEHCKWYKELVYKPTTFSDNRVSLVHLSNASAEAINAVRDEFESPDFTDAINQTFECTVHNSYSQNKKFSASHTAKVLCNLKKRKVTHHPN